MTQVILQSKRENYRLVQRQLVIHLERKDKTIHACTVHKKQFQLV